MNFAAADGEPGSTTADLSNSADAVAQMCDVGSVNHPDSAELAWLIEPVEEPNSVAHQWGNNV